MAWRDLRGRQVLESIDDEWKKVVLWVRSGEADLGALHHYGEKHRFGICVKGQLTVNSSIPVRVKTSIDR